MRLIDESGTALGSRWSRAVAATERSELDALYVTAGPNFKWLAGGSPYPGGLPVWLSALIVPAGGEGVAVISDMHAEILSLEGTGIREVITYEDGDDPKEVLRRAFAAAGVAPGSRVGVEDGIPFADTTVIREVQPQLALSSAQAIFDDLRAVKDDVEVALLRRSGAAVDAAYEAARAASWAGGTIADAGVAMYRAMIEAGANQPHVSGSFKRYTGAVIREGAIVDIDIGADCGGYSVDTARNVFVGEPDPGVVKDYELLEEAYAAAAAVVKPGVPASAVHDACADVLSAAGRRQSWKVGHGVGLASGHEAPLLQPGNDIPLRANMVFTIDPGFFLRTDEPLHIEETVLVTEDGCERLTTFPLGMLVV
jgi:Xaa-Pro aminopeptidase